jgi:hypothetical protein
MITKIKEFFYKKKKQGMQLKGKKMKDEKNY